MLLKKYLSSNFKHQENEKAIRTKQSRLGNDQQTLDEWKNNYVVIAENRRVNIINTYFFHNEGKIYHIPFF